MTGRRHHILCLPILASALVASAAIAGAGEPTAIVEDIKSKGATVQSFDYVQPGDVVKLGQSETLVLGYLVSCVRETISGGTITIGVRQSEIAAGEVQRQQVPCDPAVASLAVAQASEVGGSIIRTLDVAPQAGAEAIRIYSTTPILKAAEPADRVVSIERLDRSTPKVVLQMTGRTFDMAEAGISLEPGGRYKLQSGVTVGRVFEVDPQAQRGGGPVVSRLVTF
jgi:hypothetical protein